MIALKFTKYGADMVAVTIKICITKNVEGVVILKRRKLAGTLDVSNKLKVNDGVASAIEKYERIVSI